MKGPKDASTRRQLETIRKTFARLDFEFEETWNAKEQTSLFTIDTGVSELESLTFRHTPGLLVGVAEFGVHPAEARRKEVERFAARINASSWHGCVMVLSGSPVRLVYRVSVDYSRVKNLEGGYVAGLVAEIIDQIPVLDLPLILIAKGATADAAISKLLELEEVQVGEPKVRRAPPGKKTARRVTR